VESDDLTGSKICAEIRPPLGGLIVLDRRLRLIVLGILRNCLSKQKCRKQPHAQ
jgi:hypothetical protein